MLSDLQRVLVAFARPPAKSFSATAASDLRKGLGSLAEIQRHGLPTVKSSEATSRRNGNHDPVASDPGIATMNEVRRLAHARRLSRLANLQHWTLAQQ
jgi:hypothetical protein